MSDTFRTAGARADGWLTRLVSAFGFGAEDPRAAILAEAAEALPPREAALLAAALRFAALSAGDLAQPRGAVEALSLDMSCDAALAIFAKSKTDVLPVTGEDADDPRGAVRLLPLIAQHPATRLATLVEPLPEVPAAMPAADVLALLEERRSTLVVIINEFGGVDGYLSRSRLVDALLPASPRMHPHDDTIDARLPVEVLEAQLGTPLGRNGDDSETIGGLIFAMLGRVPEPGERVRHPGGAHLEIVEVDRRRISRVRILHTLETAAADAA